MIDLAAHRGSRLETLPLRLDFIRDLVEYEGPLLSEFRSTTGETFLYVWCDGEDQINRWLVVRTPYQVLFEYLVGRITLRGVVDDCKDRFVYIIDMDQAAESVDTWYVPIRDLPPRYLPRADSFHPRDDAIDERFQDVYVSDKWDAEDANIYPLKYLQAYAFNSVFGTGGDPSRTHTINLRLTRGWVFGTLYKHMVIGTPPADRAKLEAVSFASPGYVRFSVKPSVAAGLRESLAWYLANRSYIDEAVSDVSRWADGLGRTKRRRPQGERRRRRRVKDTDTDRAPLTDEQARRYILDVCERLGVRGRTLLERADDTKRAAKILASYRRRLAFLADRNERQEAMLVGLVPNVAATPDFAARLIE